jgi:hypothetical protein
VTIPLLNPTREGEIIERLLAATQARIDECDRMLTGVVLIEDAYKRQIYARLALKAALDEMTAIYKKEARK